MLVKIGKLAHLTGCKVVTIRYYEKEGLLPEVERSGANYRLYGPADVERLRFIRQCRCHGMRLSEIRDLLAFKDKPTGKCDWINAMVARHLVDVEAQLASLLHLKEHLEDLSRKCSGGKMDGCGILESLNRGEICQRCKSLKDASDPVFPLGREAV